MTMLGNRKRRKQKVVDTIVSEGTVIEGKLSHEKSLRIDGKVHGEIVCDGDVHIGKSGYVETTIKANNIIISGEVTGDVHAIDNVHIQPTGRLTGSVTTKGIIIDEGGIFNGESMITTDEEKVEKTNNPRTQVEEVVHD